MGIVRIGRDRTVHLCLCLFVAMIEEMDTAKEDARAHFGFVKIQGLVCHFLRAA